MMSLETDMRRPALTLALLAVIAGACTGGGDPTSAPATPLSLDELPASYPPDFPLYPGAELLAAARDDTSVLTGLRVLWATSAAIESVTAFYSGAFEEGPWKAPGATDIGTALVWTAENDEDERRAIVSVSKTADGTTQIVVLLGDFGEGAGPGEPASFHMPERPRSNP
jgi:hypothetical protein